MVSNTGWAETPVRPIATVAIIGRRSIAPSLWVWVCVGVGEFVGPDH